MVDGNLNPMSDHDHDHDDPTDLELELNQMLDAESDWETAADQTWKVEYCNADGCECGGNNSAGLSTEEGDVIGVSGMTVVFDAEQEADPEQEYAGGRMTPVYFLGIAPRRPGGVPIEVSGLTQIEQAQAIHDRLLGGGLV